MEHAQIPPLATDDLEERAFNRGDSDAYYRRRPRPHIWLDTMGRVRVEEGDMSEEQIAAYWRGFNENPSWRKDWGA